MVDKVKKRCYNKKAVGEGVKGKRGQTGRSERKAKTFNRAWGLRERALEKKFSKKVLDKAKTV